MLGEYHTRTRNRRRTFWAYTYTSYNQSSVVVGQPRQLIPNYNKCVSIGGAGGSNTCKRGWGSNHPGSIMFCLADASVRPIGVNVDMGSRTPLNMGVLPAMATMANGEINLLD